MTRSDHLTCLYSDLLQPQTKLDEHAQRVCVEANLINEVSLAIHRTLPTNLPTAIELEGNGTLKQQLFESVTTF